MMSGENISGSQFSGIVVVRQWSWQRRQSFVVVFFFVWGGGVELQFWPIR